MGELIDTPLKREIVSTLHSHPDAEEFIISEIISKHCGNVEGDIFSEFFSILTHINVSEEQARLYWQQVINHRIKISKKLGRDIGFRVALLDYFLNINKKLDNPTFIEIHLYEFLTKLTLIDELTFIYNRRFFDSTIDKEFSRAKRYDLELSLFFFDLDDFKQVNDNYGHVTGDLVLQKVGTLLNEVIRKEDLPCRYGGEEFVVILPETGKKGALAFANRVLKAISEIKISNMDNKITISGGIATFPKDVSNVDDLIIFADKAMYRAKFTGKGKIEG